MRRLACRTFLCTIMFLFIVFAITSFPCECVNTWSNSSHSPAAYVQRGMADSKVVFFGKVLAVGRTNADGICEVTFLVKKAWKGIEAQSITITACNSQDCNPSPGCPYSFHVDEEYLIFWSGYPLGECSGQIRNNSLAATPYMEALGKPTYESKS